MPTGFSHYHRQPGRKRKAEARVSRTGPGTETRSLRAPIHQKRVSIRTGNFHYHHQSMAGRIHGAAPTDTNRKVEKALHERLKHPWASSQPPPGSFPNTKGRVSLARPRGR